MRCGLSKSIGWVHWWPITPRDTCIRAGRTQERRMDKLQKRASCVMNRGRVIDLWTWLCISLRWRVRVLPYTLSNQVLKLFLLRTSVTPPQLSLGGDLALAVVVDEPAIDTKYGGPIFHWISSICSRSASKPAPRPNTGIYIMCKHACMFSVCTYIQYRTVQYSTAPTWRLSSSIR